MSAGRQVLSNFMDRLAAKVAADSPPMTDVLFVGGPARGEIKLCPPEAQCLVVTDGYEYIVTDELAQRRDGTQQARVARPAGHVRCGFLPLDSLLGGFICVRGHGL